MIWNFCPKLYLEKEYRDSQKLNGKYIFIPLELKIQKLKLQMMSY